MFDFLKTKFQVGQKILILGFGKEGRSTYGLLRKYFPDILITIGDINKNLESDEIFKNDNQVEFHLGEGYQNKLVDCDIIIKSPGVKVVCEDTSIFDRITSQTDLFLQCYTDQVVGVTGTKGKSTTVSLIKHFLDAAEKDSVLIGNIGVPAFDMIDNIDENTIIVYELSAHQLEYIHRSPHIAVLLNIFPEHLDYFDTLQDYTKAKTNIYRYQSDSDTLIINDVLVDDTIISNAVEVSIGEDYFESYTSPLIGTHNKYNIDCAVKAVELVGVKPEIAISSLSTFSTLPHRLQFIGEFGGIKFINDSISTVPESTIAAVKAVGDVDILILGGFDRGLNYDGLIEYLTNSNVKMFILLGKAGNRMFTSLSIAGSNCYKASDLTEVFDIIRNEADNETTCLLSPAAASYDQFKNFEHRGDIFIELALKFVR